MYNLDRASVFVLGRVHGLTRRELGAAVSRAGARLHSRIEKKVTLVAIGSGGGSLSPASAVTNALGEVTVRWTLGPQAGLQTASATAGSVGPITISATAN